MTPLPQPSSAPDGRPRDSSEGAGLPEHDVLLDERGHLCPLPVIALGRAAAAVPSPARILLLADDPAAETDVPAWCSLRGRTLAWTGPAPDGTGRAYLVTHPESLPEQVPPQREVLDL